MEKKIWFITGISSGLGKQIASTVMDKGDFAIGSFRKQDQVDKFNREYEGKGHAVLMDVSNKEHIDSAFSVILEKFGRIDVLVNNAGYGLAGAVEETSMKEIRHLFEVNFFGPLMITQKALEIMRTTKKGHVFQMSSHSGFKGFAGFGIYGASKFALEGFSEAMATEVRPLGIKVTIVEPGPFRTGFAGSGFAMAEKEIGDYQSTSGVFRQKIKSVDGKQEGDPVKAAQIIYEMAQSENPPLRLPLGKIALNTLLTKLKEVENDIESTRKLAESAVYE